MSNQWMAFPPTSISLAPGTCGPSQKSADYSPPDEEDEIIAFT